MIVNINLYFKKIKLMLKQKTERPTIQHDNITTAIDLLLSSGSVESSEPTIELTKCSLNLDNINKNNNETCMVSHVKNYNTDKIVTLTVFKPKIFPKLIIVKSL